MSKVQKDGALAITKYQEEHGDPFKESSFRGNMSLVPENYKAFIPPDLFQLYVREIVRCKSDPIYFVNNYFYIISPAKGKHIIDTYPKQNELLETFIDNNRVVTLASRQVGKTVCFCMFVIWMVCFNEDKSILILANKMSTALEIMGRIRLAFELLPKWIKPTVKEYNKGRIELSNGCKVEGCATSSDAARGKSANVLIIDEAAFIPNNIMEELWSSIYPIISSSKDSKCIMVSTPNGTGNMYYDIFQRAELNRTRSKEENQKGEKWIDFRFDWWEVPGRDEEWKQQQLESMNYNYQQFAQEFGNEFLGSSYTLINAKLVAKQKQRVKPKMVEHFIDDEYRVKMWYEPKMSASYVIGVDVSDGTGKDNTVVTVYDITHPINGVVQVAEFANNTTGPTEAAYIACKLGLLYNFAPLMIERNNMGNSTVDFCHQIYEYENIASVGSRGLGILSNNTLKVNACLNFKKFIELACEVNSHELLIEMEYFERKNTGNGFTYSCPKGKNDDYTLASVWALSILDQSLIEYFFDVDYEKVGIQFIPKHVKNVFHSGIGGPSKDDEIKKLESKWGSLQSNEPQDNYEDADIENIGFLDM